MDNSEKRRRSAVVVRSDIRRGETVGTTVETKLEILTGGFHGRVQLC